jgi:hypothetical protein
MRNLQEKQFLFKKLLTMDKIFDILKKEKNSDGGIFERFSKSRTVTLLFQPSKRYC